MINTASDKSLGLGPGFARGPISIFSRIKKAKDEEEKKKLNQLLETLRKKLPEGFKIGAAVGEGDCFFDSVAQGLNGLINGLKGKCLITDSEEFNVKSLRQLCADCAKEYKDEIINDAKGGGYFVAQENVAYPNLGTIQDEKGNDVPDKEKTFDEYLKNIKKTADIEGDPLIWGRPEIEGKMICKKYSVKIKVIELRDEGIDGLHVTTYKTGTGDNIVYIVNYKNHFVPLLSSIQQDIEKNQNVNREEVYGIKNKDVTPLRSIESSSCGQSGTSHSKSTSGEDLNSKSTFQFCSKGTLLTPQDIVNSSRDGSGASLEEEVSEKLRETSRKYLLNDQEKEKELCKFLLEDQKRTSSKKLRPLLISLGNLSDQERRKVFLRIFFVAEFWDSSKCSNKHALRNVVWNEICALSGAKNYIFRECIDDLATFVAITMDEGCLQRILERGTSCSDDEMRDLIVKVCIKIHNAYGTCNTGSFVNYTDIIKHLKNLEGCCTKRIGGRGGSKIADLQLSGSPDCKEVYSLLKSRPDKIISMIGSFIQKIEGEVGHTSDNLEKDFFDSLDNLLKGEDEQFKKWNTLQISSFLEKGNCCSIISTMDAVIQGNALPLKTALDMAKTCTKNRGDQFRKGMDEILKRACKYIVNQRNQFIEGIAFDSVKVFELLFNELNSTGLEEYVKKALTLLEEELNKKDRTPSGDCQSDGNMFSKTGSERKDSSSAGPTESVEQKYLKHYRFDHISIISNVVEEGDSFKVESLDLKRIPTRKEGNHILPVSTFLQCVKNSLLKSENFFEATDDLSRIFSGAKKRRRYYDCVKTSFEELKKTQHCKAELQVFLENELIPFAFFAWNERATSVYYQHRTSQELGAEGSVVKLVNKGFQELLDNPPNDLEEFKKEMEKRRSNLFDALDLSLHIKLDFTDKRMSDKANNCKNLSEYLVRRVKVIQEYLDSMIECDVLRQREKISANSEEVKILGQILELSGQGDDIKYQEKCKEIEDSDENTRIQEYFNKFKIKRKFICMVKGFNMVGGNYEKYLKEVEEFTEAKKVEDDFNVLKQELIYILKILKVLKNPSNEYLNSIRDSIDKIAEGDLKYIVYDVRKLFQAWVHIIELIKTHDYQQKKDYTEFLNKFFSESDFMQALIVNREGKVEELKKEPKKSEEELSRLKKLKENILEKVDDKLELSFDYSVEGASVVAIPSSGGSDIDNVDNNVGNNSNNDINQDVYGTFYNLIEKNLKKGCSIYDDCFIRAALYSIIADNFKLFVGESKEELIQRKEDEGVKSSQYKMFNILITKSCGNFREYIIYKNNEEIKLEHIGAGHCFKAGDVLLSSASKSNQQFIENVLKCVEGNFPTKLICSEDDHLDADVAIIKPEEISFFGCLRNYYDQMIKQFSQVQAPAGANVIFEIDEALREPLIYLHVSNGDRDEEIDKKLVANTYKYYQNFWDKCQAIESRDWHPMRSLVLFVPSDEIIKGAWKKATGNYATKNRIDKREEEMLKQYFRTHLEVKCESALWEYHPRRFLHYELQRKVHDLAFEEANKELSKEKFIEVFKKRFKEESIICQKKNESLGLLVQEQCNSILDYVSAKNGNDESTQELRNNKVGTDNACKDYSSDHSSVSGGNDNSTERNIGGGRQQYSGQEGDSKESDSDDLGILRSLRLIYKDLVPSTEGKNEKIKYYKEAIELIKNAREKGLEDLLGRACLNLGSVAGDKNEKSWYYEQAREYLEDANKKKPSDCSILYSLCLTYNTLVCFTENEEKGEKSEYCREAVKWVNNAIKKGSTDTGISEDLGKVYSSLVFVTEDKNKKSWYYKQCKEHVEKAINSKSCDFSALALLNKASCHLDNFSKENKNKEDLSNNKVNTDNVFANASLNNSSSSSLSFQKENPLNSNNFSNKAKEDGSSGSEFGHLKKEIANKVEVKKKRQVSDSGSDGSIEKLPKKKVKSSNSPQQNVKVVEETELDESYEQQNSSEKEASLNIKNNNGCLPEEVANNTQIRDILSKMRKMCNDYLEMGDVDDVKNLLSEGNINAQDSKGNTVLHIVARNNYFCFAEALITFMGFMDEEEKKAYVNAKNKEGDTTLHFAANKGHKEIVEFLIEKGADVEAQNKAGDTPLRLALKNKKFNVAQCLEINKCLDDCGTRILHLFTRINFYIAIDELIEEGADVNATDGRRCTPLHLAAMYGHHEACNILMSGGANASIKNSDGQTPLEIAKEGNDKNNAKQPCYSKCIRYLKDNNSLGKVPNGNLDKDDYTKLKEFVNDKYNNGNYETIPLHFAVKNGGVKDLGILIKIGADVNIKLGKYEYTALHYAVDSSDVEKITVLIQAGADVNAKLKFNKITPLHSAARDGSLETVKALIQAGANINAAVDYSKCIPLHYAVKGGHKEVVELLVAKGSDINALDKNKDAPLDLAKEGEDQEIIKILEKENARLLCRNYHEILEVRPETTLNNVALDNQLRRRSASF